MSEKTINEHEIQGEACKTEMIFTTLRQQGIPVSLRKQLNTFRFIFVFVVNLIIFAAVGWFFIERYFKPVVERKPEDKFDYLTVFFAVCVMVLIASLIVALITSFFLKFLNNEELENASALGALAAEAKLVKIVQHKHSGLAKQENKYVLRAAAHLKGEIDSLNDLASLISLATVSGSFMTGMLFFEPDSIGKLLGSLIVWVLAIIRIYFYFRLRVKRFWQVVLDQAKDFPPEEPPEK